MVKKEKALNENQQALCNKIKELRLPAFAAALADLLSTNKGDNDLEQKLSNLVDAELTARSTKKINRLIAKAELRHPTACIDSTMEAEDRKLNVQLIHELASSKWIERKENVIITGATGLGKSYLACALALSAIQQFNTVKYFKTSALMRIITDAKKNGEFSKLLDKLSDYDVIIFDDFCFTDIDVYSGLGLFELLDARDEVKSSIFISQHEVSGWYEKFKDVSIAEACLNRITHNAQRVLMNGRNMRG